MNTINANASRPANGPSSATRQPPPRRGAKPREQIVGIIPLVLLPFAVILVRNELTAWAFMWLMAFSIYFSCKWMTWRSARAQLRGIAAWKVVVYLLGYPGMDAVRFFQRPDGTSLCTKGGAALFNVAIGAILMWGLARFLLTVSPLLAAAAGIAAIILLLHFGTFSLLALVWQRLGLNAPPIMELPAAATSVAQFWGQRWNVAFRDLSNRFLWRPLSRRFGLRYATLLTFIASGVVHELVISLPAGGGYGLPTAYFTINGVAMLAERSRIGKRCGLGHGVVGWLFTVAITVGPVCILFHPPFLRQVVLPFMQTIGAF